MSDGYAGKMLTVDLTSGTSRAVETSAELKARFLGGCGFGAKLLYDTVPAQADPLGLQVQTLQPGTPQAQAVGLTKGVLVTAVDPEGPSAQDIRPGDVITEVSRTKVDSVDAYRQALDTRRKAGAKYVVLRFSRKQQGETMSTVVDITPDW